MTVNYNEMILEKLANSRADAKSAIDIARELDITPRRLHAMIREMRKDGIPIVSDRGGKGYWIATDPHDIRMWARQSKSSAFDMLSTAETLLHIADSMEDRQISLI